MLRSQVFIREGGWQVGDLFVMTPPTLPNKNLEFAHWRWVLTWPGCMGHHDRQDRDLHVSFTLTSDDDTRPRDVTEAINVQQMMYPSAFDLIRPTIATYVAFPSFYSGGW